MKAASAKVRFALRRESTESPFRWWPVRGLNVSFTHARKIEAFSYRSGPLVFIVDSSTGVAFAFGPSLPLARREANRVIAERGVAGVIAGCKEVHNRIGPGKKPRVKKHE